MPFKFVNALIVFAESIGYKVFDTRYLRANDLIASPFLLHGIIIILLLKALKTFLISVCLVKNTDLFTLEKLTK